MNAPLTEPAVADITSMMPPPPESFLNGYGPPHGPFG